MGATERPRKNVCTSLLPLLTIYRTVLEGFMREVPTIITFQQYIEEF